MDLSLNKVVSKDQPEEVGGHYSTSQTEGKQLWFCLSVHCHILSFGRVGASFPRCVLS